MGVERSAVMPKESVQIETLKRKPGAARAEQERIWANGCERMKRKSKKSEQIIHETIYHPWWYRGRVRKWPQTGVYADDSAGNTNKANNANSRCCLAASCRCLSHWMIRSFPQMHGCSCACVRLHCSTASEHLTNVTERYSQLNKHWFMGRHCGKVVLTALCLRPHHLTLS